MMPEWHQLDLSCTMSEQQESVKKKTLKSSSRSSLFSTGLQGFGPGRANLEKTRFLVELRLEKDQKIERKKLILVGL